MELASGSILRDLAGYAGPGCVQTQVGPLACDQKGDRYAQHTAQFLVTHRCFCHVGFPGKRCTFFAYFQGLNL